MEGAPQSSKLSRELQAMYEKVKASNPIFTNLTEDEFIEFREMALADHLSAEGNTVVANNDGTILEMVPHKDELNEMRDAA